MYPAAGTGLQLQLPADSAKEADDAGRISFTALDLAILGLFIGCGSWSSLLGR